MCRIRSSTSGAILQPQPAPWLNSVNLIDKASSFFGLKQLGYRHNTQQSTMRLTPRPIKPPGSDPGYEVTPESWTPTFRGSHEKNLQSVVEVRGGAVSSPA